MAIWEPLQEIGDITCVALYAAFLIASLLLVALMVYSYAVYRTERLCRHIPGPKRESFFFGNIFSGVEFKKKTGMSMTISIYQMTKDLGQVVWVRILWRPFFFGTSAELVKELLLNSRHVKPWEVYRFEQSIFGTRLMGHGLVSELDHSKWHRKRALINPAFHRRYLMGMMDQFNEGAEGLCQHLLKKADGETEVAMLDELNTVTLDIIAKIGFSINTGATGDPTCPFPSALTTVLKAIQMMFDAPWLTIDPRSEKRKFRAEVRDAIELLRGTGRKCIQDRIAAKRRGDYVPKDILGVILEACNDMEEGDDFGMENMVDEFVTLFIAGQETTSNLLAFTLVQLGRHPEVARKVQAEIDEVLGQKPFIQYEDLAKLEYMMLVLKETLRLYPPASGTSRLTAHEIQCNGYTIPAGVTVSVMTGVMARMEEYFDDPLLFIPERFKSTGELPRHLYAYFPFSMGQRSCIGQHFALIEARVLLAKLLQRFEFRLEQSQRFDMLDEVTQKPRDRCINYVTLKA